MSSKIKNCFPEIRFNTISCFLSNFGQCHMAKPYGKAENLQGFCRNPRMLQTKLKGFSEILEFYKNPRILQKNLKVFCRNPKILLESKILQKNLKGFCRNPRILQKTLRVFAEFSKKMIKNMVCG